MSEPFSRRAEVVADFLDCVGDLDFDSVGSALLKDAVTNSYISVFRSEGDKISLHKEYLNPVRVSDAVASPDESGGIRRK